MMPFFTQGRVTNVFLNKVDDLRLYKALFRLLIVASHVYCAKMWMKDN
jgi:hypothetical protein